MADVLPFPPPVTGIQRDSDDYWHDRWVAACRRWEVERDARLRAEQQRDAYFDSLCEHAAAVAEGSLVGTVRYWFYATWLAVGLFVGHLLTRAMG